MAFPSAARSLVSLGTIILTLSIACGGGITPETIVRAIAVLPTSTPLTLAKPALTPISVTLTRRPTASPVATRTEIPSPTPEPERYRLSIAIVPDVSVEIALAPHPHSDGLYPQGTEVTVSLSATPPNVAFIRWEDYAQGDGVQMTVTVDRKLRIRALFTLRPNETPVPAPPPTTPSPPPVIVTATKTQAPSTRTPARSQLATPILLPTPLPLPSITPGRSPTPSLPATATHTPPPTATPEAGSVRWQHKTGNWIDAAPVVRDDVVYIGSQDDVFYAIPISDKAVI